MTRAAPARAPILRPGVKGAGWATGRGRGAERVWGGASNNSRGTSRSNTCRTASGQTRGNHWVWVWSDLVNNFLPYTSSYLWLLRCGGVWCPVVLISHLTTPNYLLHLTTRLFILPSSVEWYRVHQHKLRLFLLNCNQPPLGKYLHEMKTWRYLIYQVSKQKLKKHQIEKKQTVLVLIVVHSHILFVIYHNFLFETWKQTWTLNRSFKISQIFH